MMNTKPLETFEARTYTDQVALPKVTVSKKSLRKQYNTTLGPNGLFPCRTQLKSDELHLYNTQHRFVDNLTLIDEHFPHYNAARIPNTHSILAEGPDHSDSTSVARLMQDTLLHPHKPIYLFIAVGKTLIDPNEPCDFADYFQGGSKVTPEAFFADMLSREGRKALLESEEIIQFLTTLNDSDFQFYYFTSNNTQPNREQNQNYGYAIHIPSWPDHGIMAFSQANQKVLLLLALLDLDNVTHCRAGCGRSATLICAQLLFQKKVYALDSEYAVIKCYSDIALRLRQIKPQSMYLVSQYVLALELAAGLSHCYLENPALFDQLRSQTATSAASTSVSSASIQANRQSLQSFTMPGTEVSDWFFKGNIFTRNTVKKHINRCLEDRPLALPNLFNRVKIDGPQLITSLEYLERIVEGLEFTLKNTPTLDETEENHNQFQKQFATAKEHLFMTIDKLDARLQKSKLPSSDITQATKLVDRILKVIERSLQNPTLPNYSSADIDVTAYYQLWKNLFQQLAEVFITQPNKQSQLTLRSR